MRLEKRAVSIIVPGQNYPTATQNLGVKPLQDHHEHTCEKLFEAAISHPNHKIGKLSVSNKTRGEIQFKYRNTI